MGSFEALAIVVVFVLVAVVVTMLCKPGRAGRRHDPARGSSGQPSHHVITATRCQPFAIAQSRLYLLRTGTQ